MEPGTWNQTGKKTLLSTNKNRTNDQRIQGKRVNIIVNSSDGVDLAFPNRVADVLVKICEGHSLKESLIAEPPASSSYTPHRLS